MHKLVNTAAAFRQSQYPVEQNPVKSSRGTNTQEPVPLNSTVVVPRIIHQTWKTDDIPEEWLFAREQCQKLHPGYEFMLWTDKSAREVIQKVRLRPNPVLLFKV